MPSFCVFRYGCCLMLFDVLYSWATVYYSQKEKRCKVYSAYSFVDDLFPFMSVSTFAAYLGFHFCRCRVVLSSDIGFLLGLGFNLLLSGAI